MELELKGINDKKPLLPRKCVDINGKILYSEGDQAWNLIRLKKDVLNEFYQLKEKRLKFSYQMIYYRVYEDLEKAIKGLKKQNKALPVLLWLYQEPSI
ncbi:hypothetical protein HYV49_05015 [Candidatus Pacearchaeota archaeon]|nr:hypothetical protein [Candidatus Pacearchaeota archaeon]